VRLRQSATSSLAVIAARHISKYDKSFFFAMNDNTSVLRPSTISVFSSTFCVNRCSWRGCRPTGFSFNEFVARPFDRVEPDDEPKKDRVIWNLDRCWGGRVLIYRRIRHSFKKKNSTKPFVNNEFTGTM
jgi:hypothetical protein